MTGPAGLRAIVLADGDGPDRASLDSAWPGWDAGVGLVIAADGGARLADRLGLGIDGWVGDGDSLGPSELEELRARGVPIRLVATEKDESDTELAVIAAAEAGAGDVTILGALGGPRFDHTLANVALLAHPALIGRSARLLDATARVTLIGGPDPEAASDAAARRANPTVVLLEGRPGDLVSLLPLSDRVRGVSAEGLVYPLRDEDLVLGPARGLSNVRTGTLAEVSVREGRLLVVETPATLPP